MTMRRAILLILVGLLAVALACASAYAQESGEKTPQQQLPHHLQTHAQAADQNLLIQIFGDIARAASGQISLTDVVLGTEGDTGPMDTDSLLSGLMFIYLAFAMVIAGLLVVVLIALMAAQAGIEGKILSQRYSEWAIIRTLYAVFAILPAAGGWSIGQYAILNGTFLVNSVANEMHTFSNRYVFARGTTGSIYMDHYHFRRVVETVYLNEVCAATVNRYYEEEKNRKLTMMERLEERREKVSFNILTNLEEAIDIMGRAMGIHDSTEQTDPFLVTLEERGETKDFSDDRLYTNFHWSNKRAGEGACGSVEIDYTGFTKKEGSAPMRTLEVYYKAHSEAIKKLTKQVNEEVKTVSAAVWAVKDTVDPRLKQLRREELETLLDGDHFRALAGLFDTLAPVAIEAYDELVNQKTAEYIKTVREAYNRETDAQAKLFDDLILELQRQQASGSTADYLADIELATVENKLPPEFDGLVDDGMIHLIENTRHGWLYSGFKWWDVSRASANTEALAQHRPVANTFRNRIQDHPKNLQDLLIGIDRVYTQAVSLRGYQGDTYFNPEDEEALVNDLSKIDGKEAQKEGRRRYFTWISNTLFSVVFSDLERGDALMSIQRGGHRLLNISATMMGIAGSMKIFAAVADTGAGMAAKLVSFGMSEVKGAILAAIFTSLAATLTFLAFIFLAVGILYAVYLPLLPAMIWTFGIVGWLEKLISLIIAFPYWMIGHIIPDGDGLVNGIGRQGYIQTASVLLRPLVMVISMNVAMVTLDAVTALLAHFYKVFIPSVHADHGAGLFIQVGSFVVFAGFIVIVTHMILNWIYKIPDDLGPLLGGAGGNFGEGEAKSQSQGIAGMVFSQTQGTSSLMGGRDPNRRMRRRSFANRASQGNLGY